MDVVYTTHKGRHLGTNEKYYIHRDTTKVHKLIINAQSQKTKFLMY
jgi:hypothetical protein